MRYKYIKCFWNSSDEDTQVAILNDVDTEYGRLSVRSAEVFPDRRVVWVSGEGVGYEYGAAVPTVREINADKQFFAGRISTEGSLKSLPIGEVYGRTVCD